MLRTILIMSLAVACQGKSDGTDTSSVSGDGGSVSDGGSSDGGASDGGASDGGASDGGATDDTGNMDGDGDGWTTDVDCDDTDPSVHPEADELCNGVDDDCDGEVDEDATDATTWYTDNDNDGYGDDATAVTACDPPSEHAVSEGGDCDDTDPAYHPGATEDDCTDPNDYNCDGSTGYADADGDGVAACEDCDDADPTAFPGGTEVCDEVDNDCDGSVDEEATDATTWYEDADGDGYGNPAISTAACEQPTGTVADDTDCDDADASVNPGATEVCNEVDDDCDGDVDEEAADASTWYADADGDGYGDAGSTTTACDQPTGTVSDDTDCDDADASVYPGADEFCDEVDNDCDGDVDEEAVDMSPWYADADGDGYGDGYDYVYACDAPSGRVRNFRDCDDTDAAVNPAATEVCDGIDNDCDGDADWGLGVPDSYAAIQDAIDAASDGDTICVASGTYVETIDFDGKDVFVYGWEGAETTTIDGDGSGPVVLFASRETADAKLAGFTITGGDAEEGAGIYVNNADPTLQDLVVSGNTCTTTSDYCYGTGIYLEDSQASLDGLSIAGNTAEGTLYAGRYGYAYGVGLYATGSDLAMQDVDLTDNEHASSASYYLTSYGIGAAFVNTDVAWSGGTISGNTNGSASATYASGAGAGIYLSNANFDGSHLVVADNAMTGGYSGYGGGVAAYGGSDLALTNVIVANNEVEGGSGWYGYAYVMGGGVFLGQYANGALENCDIVGNAATASSGTSYGGGVATYYYADLTLLNTNLVANEADKGGALGTYYSSYLGSTDITYSNFYDNGTDEFEGYSDPVGSDGNISDDPLYADTSATDGVDWDLSLDPSSPCVDAGDPSMTDVDGSVADIGAYGGAGGGW